MTVINNQFKIYFRETKNMLPMEGILEKLEQNGFIQPENFVPQAIMKDLQKNKFTLDGENFYQEYLKNGKKIGFHKPENPFLPTGMQGLFKNTFPQDGKMGQGIQEWTK